MWQTERKRSNSCGGLVATPKSPTCDRAWSDSAVADHHSRMNHNYRWADSSMRDSTALDFRSDLLGPITAESIEAIKTAASRPAAFAPREDEFQQELEGAI